MPASEPAPARGSLRRTAVVAAMCFLVLLALSGWNMAVTARLHRRNPVPGGMYKVDGHPMHLYCTGAGSPTIVIEAGLGNDWLDAQTVQPGLSRTTRVCTYDRSGLGWSEPGPGPRDAVTIAHQLHSLLNAAGVPRPLVLMGHSGGGIYARVFTNEFPAEVAGVVLVDAATPEQFQDLPGFRSSFNDFLHQAPDKSRWKKLRIVSGLQRLAGKCHRHPPRTAFELAGQYDAEMCRLDYEGGGNGEYVDFAQSAQQALEHAALATKMLLILSADPERRTAKMTPLDVERATIWDTEQEAMKSLSATSRRVVVQGSGHNIYHDRPDVVIAEVGKLIVSLRERSF